MIQKKVKKMRKTKLSLALSALLVGGLFSSSAQAVNLTEDGLGDAAIFQYYTAKETANGKWRTFIRVINTSEDSVAAKVRFREAANSREVLDFTVFLSPKDEWVAWVDPNADGLGNPGIRTDDESCLYPEVGSTDQTGEGFFNLNADTRYALFKDRTFTTPYADGTAPATTEDRLHEGYAEVIGTASWLPGSQMSQDIEHNSSGIPTNCARVNREFENFESQGGTFLSSVEQGLGILEGSLTQEDYDTVVASEASQYLLDPIDLPRGVDNVLAANAYLINVTAGLGAGYDPLILANFRTDWGDDLNADNPLLGLARNVLDASYMIRETVQTDTKPNMDSASPFTQMLVTNTKGAEYIEGYWGTSFAFDDQISNQFDSGAAFNQNLAGGNPPQLQKYRVALDGDNDFDDPANSYRFDANNNGVCELNEGVDEQDGPAAVVGKNVVRLSPNCYAIAESGGFTPRVVGYTVDADYDNPARIAQLAQVRGNLAVTGGVDAVSGLLMRDSVINEWAAARDDTAKVSEYFTQWVLSFPTKHFYVDLQNDPSAHLLDYVAPTLRDLTAGNDAFAPFSQEYAQSTVSGVAASCEPYRVDIYNREERRARFTTPTPFENPYLCHEVNVLKFGESFASEGLDSSFGTVVPQGQFPVDADTGLRSDRGWAHLAFTGAGASTGLMSYREVMGDGFPTGYLQVPDERNNAAYDHYAGLPVTGFMFSVYNTNSTANNHATVNDHKYTRDISCVDQDIIAGDGSVCESYDWTALN